MARPSRSALSPVFLPRIISGILMKGRGLPSSTALSARVATRGGMCKRRTGQPGGSPKVIRTATISSRWIEAARWARRRQQPLQLVGEYMKLLEAERLEAVRRSQDPKVEGPSAARAQQRLALYHGVLWLAGLGNCGTQVATTASKTTLQASLLFSAASSIASLPTASPAAP